MKDIKDYLHLYLGCECIVQTEYGVQGAPKKFTAFIHGFYYDMWTTHGENELSIQVVTEHGARWTYKLEQVKLVLRPLLSMIEEEKDDFADHGYDFEDNGELPVNIWKGVNMSSHVLWLLSKGFDLFGLIEAGLAIDKTTLTVNQ